MGQAGGQSRCNRPVRRPANAVGFGFSSWPPNDRLPSLPPSTTTHWVKELWRQSRGREGWLGGSSVCGGGCCRAEGEEDDCDWRASDSWNCQPQIEGRREDQNIESERVIVLTIEVPVQKGEGPNE